MKSSLRTTLAALCAAPPLLCSVSAQAHQIWIEQDAGHAVLLFGEFADNVRETTPGLLDHFGQPEASRQHGGGTAALKLEKTASGFMLSATAAAGESIVAEDAHYPISESTSKGVTTRWAYTPAARYVGDLSPRQPSLTLDIVPVDGKGSFQVSFKGQPMARYKVQIVMPAGWSREALSNEHGVVQFALPWRGLYVIELHHEDKTPGRRDGKAYDIGSYVTSLSFNSSSGLPALAAPAPATHSAASH